MGDAGRDDLPTARPARHEMRLDEPGGDPQIGLGEEVVDPHGCSARCRDADIDMVLIPSRIMVLDPHMLQHPGVADEFFEFLAQIGPVQPGGDEHRDLVARDARRHQRLDHRAQA
ncbi:hypothetical protein NS226_05700 [Aureimonas ureilytica]|uniref:Uncharacterized protein n=1 Tax=Aureimonas ureilytica TaxID=401562 RepID=A0A175RDH6_9HYPH|nr:hypothetical protein NS226_05700 [Aureimonas ureilytica]